MVLALFLLISVVFFFWYYRRMVVIRTSVALSELDALNTQTRWLVSSEYNNTIQVIVKCRTKTQYDSKTLHQCLAQYLADHYKAFSSIYEAVLADMDVNKEYCEEYSEIQGKIGRGWQSDGRISLDDYLRIENRLYKRRKLPAPGFRIDVRKTYVSPKKRNHYQDQGYFYASTFVYICDKLHRHHEKRKLASAERKLMTNELRYQILLRDEFRCQICGRSQEDGVILHIDHIKPISKGGKTIPSNLRVLCSDCNLGKSDHYRPGECN